MIIAAYVSRYIAIGGARVDRVSGFVSALLLEWGAIMGRCLARREILSTYLGTEFV